MGKKLIVIAEIVFAVIFIIIMATIFMTVSKFGNSANSTIESIQTSIADAELQSYNGTTVSGDTVISTINKLKETKNNVKLSYLVEDDSYGYNCITNQSSTGSEAYNGEGNAEPGVYLQSASTSYSKYNTSLRPGEDGFISPVKEYTSTIICNSNGTIIGMMFKES